MINFPGIYEIINLTNGKRYIGSAVNLSKRLAQHKSNLNKNRHPNKYLQSSYNKHGKSNFEFRVIEYIENKIELIHREQLYLDWFKCYNRKYGYNARPTAESNLGRITSEEVKIKLSLYSPKRKRDIWPHDLGNRCMCEECKGIRADRMRRYRENKFIAALDDLICNDNTDIDDSADDIIIIKMPADKWEIFKDILKL